MCTSGIFCTGPKIMALLKYFKHIKPSEEEKFKVFYLNQIVLWHV